MNSELELIARQIQQERNGRALLFVRTSRLTSLEQELPPESKSRGLEIDPVECARGMLQLYRSYRELVNNRNSGLAAIGSSVALGAVSWLPQALTTASMSPLLTAYPTVRFACRGLAVVLALSGGLTEMSWQTGNKEKASQLLEQAFVAQQSLNKKSVE